MTKTKKAPQIVIDKPAVLRTNTDTLVGPFLLRKRGSGGLQRNTCKQEISSISTDVKKRYWDID